MKKIGFAAVLSLFAFGTPLAAFAATGDVTGVRIEPNGWVADIDIEGFQTGGAYNFGLGTNNVPVNPTLAITVQSQGYDTNGNPTTVTRTVYGTQWLRKLWPINTGTGPGTVKDENVSGNTLTLRVALSDFVYAGDSNVTAVVNNLYKDNGTGGSNLYNATSTIAITNTTTLPYPKVIGRWAWPGFERVTGDFPVEASVFDRFPENGSPVAVVIFTATDQHGHTVNVPSTSVTHSVHTGDANLVQTYGATIPVSAFTQGDQITVNFKAYPWVGNASSTLDSANGVAQPSEQLGPMYELNDAQGTYGVGYALVSPNGALSTAKVYSSEAAAEAAGDATAFPNIGKAAEAIKAYQQANFGRANAGGGVILLASGTYNYPGYSPAANLGPSATWLIVRPAAGVARSQATILGTTSFITMDKIKFDGVTISSPSTFTRGNSSTDYIWFHNSSIDMPSASNLSSYKSVYATQNNILSFGQNMSSIATYHTPFALVRGNSAAGNASIQADLYAILGNKNIRPKFNEAGNGAGHAIGDNAIYAFNTLYGLTAVSGNMILNTDILNGDAFVENVMEKTNPSSPLFQLSADGSYSISNNEILWRNTFAGERQNIAYNQYGSVPFDHLNWSMKYNIYQNWNNKDDRFSDSPTHQPNANRIGGLPVGYNVGSNGNTYSITTGFPPEFNGLSSKFGAGPGFVRDGSTYGSAQGNGDYTLIATSSAIDVAGAPGQFDQMLPYDLLGVPMMGAGIDAGAYEYTGGPAPDVTPPTISNAAPTGQLPVNTATTTLSVQTNEAATCRYATSGGAAFSSMTTFDTTGGTSHATALSGLTNGTAYTYYVKCQDVAGNISGDTQVSFSVAAPVVVDVTAPTVSITTPADGASVTGSVTIAATSTDDVGVTDVTFLLDGAQLGAKMTAAPYTYAWDTSLVAPGSHTLTAIAHDAAGNTGTSTPVNVTVTVPVQGGADTTTGQIVHLTFDTSSINGTVASDASGNNNNGTLVGSPTIVAGHLGDALNFNATNYVDLGTSSFGLGNAYSVSFWVKLTGTSPATYPVMTGRGQYAYPFSYQIYPSSTNRWRLTTRTSNGTALMVPTNTGVAQNVWYHVVVTQAANGVRTLYVNGTQVATDTLVGTTSWATGNNWVIGKLMPNSTADGWMGAIDDYRVYNRALTSADVSALYAGQ